MADPITALTARWESADPYDYAPADLREAQLAAATERLHRCRASIPLLDRRARDAGVEDVQRPEELIPLLLSHTSYKSYPRSFIEKRRWSGLARWLETLSTVSLAEVSFDGIDDIDGWVARLHEAGHYVMSSSGTSGKPSFILTTETDHTSIKNGYIAALRAMTGVVPDASAEAFLAVPQGATTVVQLAMNRIAEDMAPPGSRHHLSDRPMLLSDLNRMGDLRQAIADGSASPDTIAAFETAARERSEVMTGQLESFIDQILNSRDRPVFLAAAFGMLWRIVETGQARGLVENAFHPGSAVFTGGGLKGIAAPPDFKEHVARFVGDEVGMLEAYGMSELNGPFARCDQQRYHVPPTTILLPLDKAGEKLIEPRGGTASGVRCAAFDVLVDGRWGGLISGDRVTVQYGMCGCGRRSPAVHEISRFSDLAGGDDKLSCAGSVDAYIRGVISEEFV